MSLLSLKDQFVADHYWEIMQGWWPEHGTTKKISTVANVYLISSYLYYQLNESVLSDPAYDKICKDLLTRFDEISQATWHSKLLSRESLSAGTLYDLKSKEYPSLIKAVAFDFYRRLHIPTEE